MAQPHRGPRTFRGPTPVDEEIEQPPGQALYKGVRRLTEEEKRKNHIASEQKRRIAIRAQFDRLASAVPGLEGQGRSEAVVLGGTIEQIVKEAEERQELLAKLKASGVPEQELVKFELDSEFLKRVEAAKVELASREEQDEAETRTATQTKEPQDKPVKKEEEQEEQDPSERD